MILNNRTLKINIFFMILASSFSLSAKELAVAVKKIVIRQRPSFLSKRISEAKYGDHVALKKKKGSWIYIELNNKNGWVHASAVGERKSILADIGRGQKVAEGQYKDEVSLAGKGFNPEYEQAYSAKNPKVDFKNLDYMENMIPSSYDIKKFVKDGSLVLNL